MIALSINGCLGYPVSEKSGDVDISGDINGLKSNFDEKINKVIVKHGTQYILSPEGDRRFMTGGESYEYYLVKGDSKTSLSFLNSSSIQPGWDAFLNLNGKWFAISAYADPEYFRVIKFTANGGNLEFQISAKPTDAISAMYIDINCTNIIWKQINDNYFQYSLEKRKMIRRHVDITPAQLEPYIKIPSIMAKYEEKTFFEDYNNDEIPYSNNRRTYSGISPLDISKTDSVTKLREASGWRDYLFRWAVAINEKTPKDILEKLSHDTSYYVANEARKRLRSLQIEN